MVNCITGICASGSRSLLCWLSGSSTEDGRMTIRKLLVFGATGTQGHPVVEEALAVGLEVRAVTRDMADARARLTASAELVRADLLDAVSVTEAMAGCQAVFRSEEHTSELQSRGHL